MQDGDILSHFPDEGSTAFPESFDTFAGFFFFGQRVQRSAPLILESLRAVMIGPTEPAAMPLC